MEKQSFLLPAVKIGKHDAIVDSLSVLDNAAQSGNHILTPQTIDLVFALHLPKNEGSSPRGYFDLMTTSVIVIRYDDGSYHWYDRIITQENPGEAGFSSTL